MSAHTVTDADIAVLVGEFEQIPCEFPQHAKGGRGHDNGPATHYASGQCPECDTRMDASAVCQAFTDAVLSNAIMSCSKCGAQNPSRQLINILGPVKP